MNYTEIAKVHAAMVDFYKGNLSDINHTNKVFSYASYIGFKENLNNKDYFILLISALLHDISCPLCREKYSSTNGKYQEAESEAILNEFLKPYNFEQDIKDRIIYLISHHHSPQLIDNIDFQILIEADYIVNAEESHYSIENIRNTEKNIFKTESGKALLKEIYFS